jgi:hypothetical protein
MPHSGPILSKTQAAKLLRMVDEALKPQRGRGYGVPLEGPTPAVLPPKWLDELPLRVKDSSGTAAAVTLERLRTAGLDKLRTIPDGASGKTARENERGQSEAFDDPALAGAPTPFNDPYPDAAVIPPPGANPYSLAAVLQGAPPGSLTPDVIRDTLWAGILEARARSQDDRLYIVRGGLFGGDAEWPIVTYYYPTVQPDDGSITMAVDIDRGAFGFRNIEQHIVTLDEVLYRPRAQGGNGLATVPLMLAGPSRRSLSAGMHDFARGRLSHLPHSVVYAESGIVAPAHAPSSSDIAGWSSYAGGGRAVPVGVMPGQPWDTEAPDHRVEFAHTALAPGEGLQHGSGAAPKQAVDSAAAVRAKAEAAFARYLGDAIGELGSDTTMAPELAAYAETVLTDFSGVVAANEVPDSGDGKWVVNVDRRGLPGSHWTAVQRIGGKTYFYDSFGRPAAALFKAPWAKGAINVADDAEQLEEQNLCGAASIAWLRVVEALGVEAALHV